MQKAGVAAGVAAAAALLALTLLLVVVGSDDEGRGLNGVVCAPSGSSEGVVAGFSGSQLVNAAQIVAAGAEVGAPQRAQVIAVATAMQESTLLMYANDTVPESLQLPHERVGSDHDSVGLFQQRDAWGSVAERMDAKASAKLFYEALFALGDWESLPLTVAAQRVQISAFPDAYAKWEQPANQVVGSVAGIACSDNRPGSPDVVPSNPLAQPVIERAVSQLGVNYVWAGGDAEGPTNGGFDCSGLMVYAYAGIGVTVPHQTQQIWATFQPPITDPARVEPGDMILFSDNGLSTGIDHVGLYLGDSRMVHAPETGSTVEIVEDVWSSSYWSQEFIGAVRPRPAATDPRE